MKVAGQATQSQVGTLPLGGIGGGFDLVARLRRAGIGGHWARFLGQQAVDVNLRNVKSAKSIVSLRIGRTAARDGRPDARLDQLQPAQHMDERRIGRPTPALPRKRGRESTRVYGHSYERLTPRMRRIRPGCFSFPERTTSSWSRATPRLSTGSPRLSRPEAFGPPGPGAPTGLAGAAGGWAAARPAPPG